MTDTPNQFTGDNWLEEPKKRSETINVLTILTFVGSGLAIVTQLYSFFTVEKTYQQLLEKRDQLDQMPDFAKKLMGGDPIETARRSMENRVPITLLNLIAAVLCIVGAIQMRKLKKQGFPIYIIGELLPFVAYIIFIGSFGWSLGFGVLIALVFIILYATQLKYLK